MIIFMCDLICITNRNLCGDNFISQIERIARAQPKAIILREKDLTPDEYFILAKQVMAICKTYNTPCILHNFVSIAQHLDCHSIHLPLPVLRNISEKEKQDFEVIGTSCHSMEEAKEAVALGCNYITLGHIFSTDCKKGVPGRGLRFLQSVCDEVKIPVYAIGGIKKETYPAVKKAGAAGACMMSGFMCCEDVLKYIREVVNEI